MLKGAAIIVAAGTASRMQGIDKITYPLGGVETIVRTIQAFEKSECIGQIAVVTRPELIDNISQLLKSYQLNKVTHVVAGGATRQQSVQNGLCCLGQDCCCIMIHDGARPFISPARIRELFDYVITRGHAAAAIGVRVKDTIKQVDENLAVISTLDRSQLFITQTPQCFEAQLYRCAMKNAVEAGKDFTDDCQLIEWMGEPVYFLEGDYSNIKITTKEDILIAESLIKEYKL